MIAPGVTIGYLTVVARASGAAPSQQKARARWECRCRCGRTIVRRGDHLGRAHLFQSCGCVSRWFVKTISQQHGHARGAGSSATYSTWCSMRKRCEKSDEDGFAQYGGKGISLCKAWRDDFCAFLNDMGERPPGRTIDRIDNRFGYFPANCRWATPLEQRHNQARWRLRHVPATLTVNVVVPASPANLRLQ